ncbi:Toxin YoeB [Proteus vulgaris]|nr:Toxin YoeB [Proteus vulgaris]
MDDYLYWQQIDKKIIKRINELIKDIKRTPFNGIGKPEPLKHNLTVFCSRRITDEYRLIYRVTDPAIEISPCRTIISSLIFIQFNP